MRRFLNSGAGHGVAVSFYLAKGEGEGKVKLIRIIRTASVTEAADLSTTNRHE